MFASGTLRRSTAQCGTLLPAEATLRQVSVAAKGGLDEVISLLMDMLQKFSTHFEEDRTNWEARRPQGRCDTGFL